MIVGTLLALAVIWSCVLGLLAVIGIYELRLHLEERRFGPLPTSSEGCKISTMDIRYNTEVISYDPDQGDVRIEQQMDGVAHGATELIKIRQGLVDKAVRDACVIELEKLGYTVTPPEGSD